MILVTGATGRVGGHLTRQLLEAGQPVRILTRSADKASRWKGEAEIVEGDLDDPRAVHSAMQGVDRFFLVTSSTSQDANVLAAAKESGASHVVKLSTLEAVDPSMAEHVKWHRQREQMIEDSGLAWTFLRPTMFMSTALDWVDTIRREGVFHFPAGDGKVPAVDPYDVAAAAAAALTERGHEGHAYALTGPEALSFTEMAEILSDVLGRPVSYISVPVEMTGAQMRRAGLPGYVVAGLMGTFKALQEGKVAACSEDIARVTGRPPRTFRTWCEANRSAFLEEPTVPAP